MLGSDSPALACPCPGRLAPQLLELTGRGAWRSEVPSELVTLVLAGWKVPCCHRETQSPWALRGGMGSVHKAPGGRAACPLASALWCRCSSLHRALQDTPSSGPGACPWLGLSQDGPFRACSGLPGRELGRSRPCRQRPVGWPESGLVRGLPTQLPGSSSRAGGCCACHRLVRLPRGADSRTASPRRQRAAPVVLCGHRLPFSGASSEPWPFVGKVASRSPFRPDQSPHRYLQCGKPVVQCSRVSAHTHHGPRSQRF